MWAGTITVATRLRKIGVPTLKEHTKKVITAMLVALEMERINQMPPYMSIARHQGDRKGSIGQPARHREAEKDQLHSLRGTGRRRRINWTVFGQPGTRGGRKG